MASSEATGSNVRLYSGDYFLQLTSPNDKISFGKLYIKEDAVPKVIWDDSEDKEKVAFQMTEKCMVIDRRLSVGQRVKKRFQKGEIIGELEFATLSIFGEEVPRIISSDVPVENLEPLTSCFYGVNVEYNSWIGIIQEVERRYYIQFQDNTIIYVTSFEPKLSKTLKLLNGFLPSNRGYPFIPHKTVNFLAPGITTRLTRKFLTKYATWIGETYKHSTQDISQGPSAYDMKECRVIDTRIRKVRVDWLGRIDKESNDIEPPTYLYKPQIPKLKYFFVHPTRYVYKGGVCSYKVEEKDEIETKIHWEESVKDLINGVPDGATPSKQAKAGSAVQGGEIMHVKKHILKHHFRVKFDNGESSVHPGCDLEIDLPLFPGNSILPYIFVTRNQSSSQGNHLNYGVIVRRVGPEHIEVRWLTHQPPLDEPTFLDSNEKFIDLIPHLEFNKLAIGKNVRKIHVEQDESKTVIDFGTIVHIDRQDLGRVTMYSCMSQTRIVVWPFDLEVISYDPYVYTKEEDIPPSRSAVVDTRSDGCLELKGQEVTNSKNDNGNDNEENIESNESEDETESSSSSSSDDCVSDL